MPGDRLLEREGERGRSPRRSTPRAQAAGASSSSRASRARGRARCWRSPARSRASAACASRGRTAARSSRRSPGAACASSSSLRSRGPRGRRRAPSTRTARSPACLFAPPAIWEALAAAAGAALDAQARTALDAALERVRAGEPPADHPALARVRTRLGLDRLDQPIVSAAPSPDHLLQFLPALGVPVVNLYALTEVPPVAIARPHPTDIGTAGRPVGGVEVRLAADGEVLVRHPAASAGYRGRDTSLFDTAG